MSCSRAKYSLKRAGYISSSFYKTEYLAFGKLRQEDHEF
jgi:hypothetical protein